MSRRFLTLVEQSEQAVKGCEALLELEDLAKSYVATLDVHQQACWTARLLQVQEKMNLANKAVNRLQTALADTLCRSMVTEDIDVCRDAYSVQSKIRTMLGNEIVTGETKHKFTLTPAAKAYYTVSDAALAFAWLQTQGHAASPADCWRIVSSVRAMRDLCNGILENGEELPPGIKAHVVCNVRLKKWK